MTSVTSTSPPDPDRARQSGRDARIGVLLGVGMGGFLDGIVLHQILQWHHLISSRVPPTDLGRLQVNTFWDGVFHALTWTVTAVGLVLLWGRPRGAVRWRSSGTSVGSLLLGWGLFNLADSVLNHYILGIHHVREDVQNVAAWDLGFLLLGGALVAVGLVLLRDDRAGRGRVDDEGSPPADLRRSP